MKKNLLCCLFLLFSFGIGAHESYLRNYQKLIDQLSVLRSKRDFDKAIKLIQLREAEINAIPNDTIRGSVYNSFGMTYDHKGDFANATKYYLKSIRAYKKIKIDDVGLTYCNLGALYQSQEKYALARKYINKASEFFRITNNPRYISMTLTNLATIYQSEKNYQKAIAYGKKSLEIDTKIKDTLGMIINCINLASNSIEQSLYDESYKYIQRIQEIDTKKQYLDRYCAGILARIYFQKKEYQKAIEANKRSVDVNIKDQNLDILIPLLKDAVNFNEAVGNYQKALHYQKLYQESCDKFKKTDEMLQQARLETSHRFTIQKEKEKAVQQSKDERQQIILLFTISGLLLLSVLLFFLFRKWNQTKRLKNEMEIKNSLLATRNAEIEDSINYAKRIQEAILPTHLDLEKAFGDVCVVYIPKDVIAGDFYWYKKTENAHWIAVADCTGHGVPGAMMSMLCNQALTKALIEYKCNDPGELLNITRNIIIEELSTSGKNIKDGMDISVCKIPFNVKEIEYAGANNNLWVYRKESRQIEIIEAKRESIGVNYHYSSFHSTAIKIYEGDRIYLFSDGFQDQFGGISNKKYKAKQLQKFIASIQENNLSTQHVLLEKEYLNWKGQEDQIDDVSILGIELK